MTGRSSGSGTTYGFSEALSRQFDILGEQAPPGDSPDRLLPGARHGSGPVSPRGRPADAGCTLGFYFVLRGLRLPPRDAIPIALLALLFPWASSVRFWPTGALNNFAVLLLFAGFLIALRGLRVEGPRGLLIHLAATACYVASILTYEVTTALALFAWIAYAWLGGWRARAPSNGARRPGGRRGGDLHAGEHQQVRARPSRAQLRHVPDMLGRAPTLIAGSLLPAEGPGGHHAGIHRDRDRRRSRCPGACRPALARRPGQGEAGPGIRWPVVAVVALGALALCWAAFIPQAFYTPTFRGIEDRVNILALYPAAVLVWAVLRAAGSLLRAQRVPARRRGRGRRRDRPTGSRTSVAGPLAALHRPPAEGACRGRAGPRRGWRGRPGLRLPGGDRTRGARPRHQLRPQAGGAPGDLERRSTRYPVFRGSTIRCSPKGVAIDYLATPLYDRISAHRGGHRKAPAVLQRRLRRRRDGTARADPLTRAMHPRTPGVQARPVVGPLQLMEPAADASPGW